MAHEYGRIKRGEAASPSSSGAIRMALVAHPHANLLRPENPQIAETARRSAFYDVVRGRFEAGMLAHEILDRYPEERHWLQAKLGDWEVVFRREQLDFIENRNQPEPIFSATEAQQSVEADYLPLPALEVDKPHLKAVAIKATVWRSDTGKAVEELVWLPRSQIKEGMVSKWIVDKKRKEIEAKYPVKSIDNFPE